MSGPTNHHGRGLLAMIAEIETLCEEALSQGHAPLLDAVSTAKLLRALVAGAPNYTPDDERISQRLALAKHHGYIAGGVPIAWETKPPVGAEEDGAS